MLGPLDIARKVPGEDAVGDVGRCIPSGANVVGGEPEEVEDLDDSVSSLGDKIWSPSPGS